MPNRHYTYWRILYEIYWKADALYGACPEFSPRLDNWINDRMDRLGVRLGFLSPERMDV